MKRPPAVISGLSLAKLRAGFVLLGAVLLVGLGALFWLLQERLAEARRDREEMVALRVFDEMEREVSSFLEGEEQRPIYGNLQDTDPGSWAPFVVGYFKQTGSQTDVVAADGATSENKRRMLWALGQASGQVGPVNPSAPALEKAAEREEGPTEPPLIRLQEPKKSAPRAQPLPVKRPAPLAQKKEASGSEIIGTLNRAQVRRKAPKKQAPPQEQKADEDQFMDYSRRF